MIASWRTPTFRNECIELDYLERQCNAKSKVRDAKRGVVER
jgi:hypothetical protein